jgi:hypothetical protein
MVIRNTGTKARITPGRLGREGQSKWRALDRRSISIGERRNARSWSRQSSASPGVKYNSTDVDRIIGGGLAFDVGGRRMTVGVRYDVGFVKFLTDSDSKNRVLSFMGTLEWPFHK